jgi:hypothetical protein
MFAGIFVVIDIKTMPDICLLIRRVFLAHAIHIPIKLESLLLVQAEPFQIAAGLPAMRFRRSICFAVIARNKSPELEKGLAGCENTTNLSRR